MEKILDIKVNYADALQRVVEYKQKINELRQAQKQYDQAVEEGNMTEEQAARMKQINATQIAVLNDGVRKLSKTMQNQLRIEQTNNGSLEQMRALLSNLTAEYDSLGDRASERGVELKQRINDVTTALKAEEEATQRYYRNVGNYENAIKSALGNLNDELTQAQRNYANLLATEGSAAEVTKKAKEAVEELQMQIKFTEEAEEGFTNSLYSFIPFGKQIQALLPLIGSGAKGVANAFKLATQGAKILGQQLLALMANPIVAFLGVLAATITLVANGIKGSEDNTNQWMRILAPFQRALAGLSNVMTTLAGWILNVVEFSERALLALFKFAEAATSIFPSLQNAIKGVNAAIEESIELAAREAQLDRDRGDFLVEESKRELEIAKLRETANDRETKTAEERLAANKEAIQIERELADERLRLAEEEFAIAKARAEWSDNSKEDNDELSRLESEVYKARKSYYDNTMKLQKQQQSLENEIAAERKAKHEEYKRQQEARIKLANEIAEKEVAAVRALEDALLELVEDSAEQQRQRINLQYDRDIEALQKRYDEENNLTEKAKDAILQTIIAKEQQRRNELDEIDKQISEDQIKKETERAAKLLDLRLAGVVAGSDAERELRLQKLQEQMNAELLLAENDQELRTAIEAKFAKERAAIQDEYSKAEEERAKKEVEVQQAKATAIGQIYGSIGKTIEALAGKSKAAAKMAKVVGLAEVYINQGVAIAKAINTESSGDPYTLFARIAQAVTQVIASTASAFASINQAKFATGGKVRGAGSGTSDSIPAMLSNGEFVMTAKATKQFEPLLAAMNAAAANPSVIPPTQTPVSSSQNAEANQAIAESIREMNIAVSVEEINDVQTRVRAIETLDNI